jgi:hypothetical protein
MSHYLKTERFAWFDDQVRKHRFPSAGDLAGESSRTTPNLAVCFDACRYMARPIVGSRIMEQKTPLPGNRRFLN